MSLLFHHLDDFYKEKLLEKVIKLLSPDGVVYIYDVMLKGEAKKEAIISKWFEVFDKK